MSEKEFTVVVKRGTTIEELQNELESPEGSPTVPTRRVDVANARPGSQRQTHFALTEREAQILARDPRVEAVEIPPDQRDDIDIGLNIGVPGDYRKTSLDSGEYINWGLKRHISNTYNFTNDGQGNVTPSDSNGYLSSMDGTGVDIVIQDSGIQVGHPEWEDAFGNTRLQQINWYTESGISGTQSANHYRDFDGHGTHCAGIAAGKRFGWAKNARIYSQKVAGLEGTGDSGTGISVSDIFDTIRLWHNSKSGADANRPTVVNMSWGYGYNLSPSSITTGNYRGTAWNFATDYGSVSQTLQNAVGIIIPIFGPGNTTRMPIRIASVDADVQEMIDAGIHICIAAGNSRFKIDIPGGDDYDNTVLRNGVSTPYHRGSSPYDDEAFMVGNILDGTFGNLDTRSTSSCIGPGVHIWAGGSNIMSATSNTNKFSDAPYYPDNDWRQCNISGTSMASPQVAGVISHYLQYYGYDKTPAEIKALIIGDCVNDIIYDTGNAASYGEPRALMGGPNRFMFNRFNEQPMVASGAMTMTGAFSHS